MPIKLGQREAFLKLRGSAEQNVRRVWVASSPRG